MSTDQLDDLARHGPDRGTGNPDLELLLSREPEASVQPAPLPPAESFVYDKPRADRIRQYIAEQPDAIVNLEDARAVAIAANDGRDRAQDARDAAMEHLAGTGQGGVRGLWHKLQASRHLRRGERAIRAEQEARAMYDRAAVLGHGPQATDEPERPPRRRSWRDAANAARDLIPPESPGVAERLDPDVAADISSLEPSPAFFKDTFKLQSAIEKLPDKMNYLAYGREMWQKFLPELPAEGPEFDQFMHEMVAGLHAIDMSESLAPDFEKMLPALVDRYQGVIADLVMWSTGDVDFTGYQDAKLASSGAAGSYLRNLFRRSWLSGASRKSEADRKRRRQGAREFVTEHTEHLVANDKFAKLGEYLGTKRAAVGPEVTIKLVIIEDSTGNFDKAQALIDGQPGLEPIELVKIWFTGSREGEAAQAKAEAEGRAAEHKEYKKSLNSIEKFEDLLTNPKFMELLEGGTVLVDFDGVIGDNVRMRKLQAQVIFSALMRNAAIATGRSADGLAASFDEILEREKPAKAA